MDSANQVLKEIFGFDSFRLAQEEVIHRLLVENENAVVVFPTGGGKSLTFQVPALCLDGLTLVISPLIALMKDQVDSLIYRGIKAAHLDSTLSLEESRYVKDQILNGTLKLLYVAPERLNNEGFIDMMRRVGKISLLAIDESHCISMWGASFRPEYLKIARFAEELDVERVLCLTATATTAVIGDICDKFYISKSKGVFRTPVYRPNLAFKVAVAETLEQKIKHIVPLLKARTGPSIIYVTLQKHTEEVAAKLRGQGLECMIYHAGLSAEERAKAQEQFMASADGVVVATIAFGMGIDKANIRQVMHLHLPKTLENYSQEVGRAGRDGLPSTCLMFLSKADLPILEGFARGDTCSRNDLELWLREVATKEQAPDKTIDFNHYQQGKVYDIRSNVLNLLYAELELDYNFIRAVTPYYSVYTIEEKDSTKVSADRTKIGNAVRKALRTNKAVDVVELAKSTGIDRADITKKIMSWEMDRYISTKPSQVRARYAVLNPLPQELEKITELADDLYKRMVEREDEAVRKLVEVLEFATQNECLAVHLAKYFGDVDVVPGGRCGQCTVCETGKPISFQRGADTKPDPAQIKAILNACPERDDPRLLARMAFGITSPRLTANKWSTMHPLFGSMVDVGFDALLKAFEAECAKVDYQRDEAVFAACTAASASSSSTGRKRSYGQMSGSSSSYNSKRSSSYNSGYRSGGYSGYSRGGYGGGYSRGGGYKRGRRY